MKRVQLGTVVNIRDSERIPLNTKERKEIKGNGTYPYIGANGIVDWVDEYLFDEKILCIAEDGGSWGKNEVCTQIYNEKCWVNNHAHVVTAKEDVLTEYLSYYLNYQDLNSFITGTTRGKLNQTNLKKIEIPLLSLYEQKAIVAKLDRAQRLIDIDQEMLAKYDELIQSVFLEMFGDPVTNPKGWEKEPTIEYAECIVPGRTKPKSFTGQIPWVTTSDLNHLGFTESSTDNSGLSETEINEVNAKKIPKNSVIMTCVGDLGVISINNVEIVMNQQLHAFICKERLNNIFLMFNLSFQTPYMHKMASNTTVHYMNKTVANNTPTILPPLELQKEFATFYKKVAKIKAQLKNDISKSEELFSSLVQGAFG